MPFTNQGLHLLSCFRFRRSNRPPDDNMGLQSIQSNFNRALGLDSHWFSSEEPTNQQNISSAWFHRFPSLYFSMFCAKPLKEQACAVRIEYKAFHFFTRIYSRAQIRLLGTSPLLIHLDCMCLHNQRLFSTTHTPHCFVWKNAPSKCQPTIERGPSVRKEFIFGVFLVSFSLNSIFSA